MTNSPYLATFCIFSLYEDILQNSFMTSFHVLLPLELWLQWREGQGLISEYHCCSFRFGANSDRNSVGFCCGFVFSSDYVCFNHSVGCLHPPTVIRYCTEMIYLATVGIYCWTRPLHSFSTIFMMLSWLCLRVYVWGKFYCFNYNYFEKGVDVARKWSISV